MSDDYFNLLLEMAGDDIVNPEEVRDKYVRAPFGWPGGKYKSLKHLLKHIPYRRVQVEHCGGSGVFTINRDNKKNVLTVFNDREAGVVAFFRVIQDEVKKDLLKKRLSTVIHAREEFIWCKETWKSCTDDVERAARWYYMIRSSFGELGRNFGRATNSKCSTIIAVSNGVERFDLIHDIFKGVQVENQSLFDCAKDYDGFETVHYFDPNYVDASPGIYKHALTKDQQRDLCDMIFKLKGFVALSGYANSIYDDPKYTWDDRVTWDLKSTLSSRAFTETNHLKDKEFIMGQDVAQEVLWIKE